MVRQKKKTAKACLSDVDIAATLKLYVSIGRTQYFEVYSHPHGGFVPAKLLGVTQTHAKFCRRGINEDESRNMFEEIPLSLVTKFVQASSWQSKFT